MDRTTTEEEYKAAIAALTEKYPAGMALITLKIGPPPMPGDSTPQWEIDATLETLERICEQVGG